MKLNFHKQETNKILHRVCRDVRKITDSVFLCPGFAMARQIALREVMSKIVANHIP